MKSKLLSFLIALALSLTVSSFSCRGGVIPDSPSSGEIVFLSGDLYTQRTLTADTTYHIIGNYIIHGNASLIIEEGTKITADYETKATLIALKGARAFFNGTAERPIVFTSERTLGARAPGDWGGLLFLGKAPNNIGNNILSDANVGSFGERNAIDTLGSLDYVRVEFAGANLGSDTRLAGFGFYSIGSSTSLSHLQAHLCASDGFRFIGGTVNAKYLISTGNTDDGFELSNSWIGKGQFWVCVQDKRRGNHAYEIVGNKLYPESDNARIQIGANSYYTSPTIYNATLIGKGDVDADGIIDEIDAIACLSNSQGLFYNHAIANFKGVALSIDKYSSDQLTKYNLIQLTNSVVYVKSDEPNNGNRNYGAIAVSNNERDKAAFLSFSENWNNEVADPLFTNIDFLDPLSGLSLDIRPQSGNTYSPLLSTQRVKTPVEPKRRYPGEDINFFTKVDYIGAIGADGDWLINKWAVWYAK